MNKKNILTATGIILSFTIAVGGWILISNLIEIKSNKLLSKTLSVATNTLDNISAGVMSELHDGERDDLPVVRPNLSENDIVSILYNWDSAGHETPHEPTEEQLNMEQAIEAGHSWLSFIGELNIFPDELLHFNNPRAYLFQNLPLGQGGQFLPPAYSYWTVTFTNDSMSINMVINAVTGQVWKTDMNIFKIGIEINDYDIANALTAFVSALEVNLDDGGAIATDDLTVLPAQDDNSNVIIETMGNFQVFVSRPKESLVASHSFADENANVVVMATGWQLGDARWNISNFDIYLTDKN